MLDRNVGQNKANVLCLTHFSLIKKWNERTKIVNEVYIS